jgi:hypothetical protein
MLSQEFMYMFVESAQLKDLGLLKSSLEKREEATRLVKNDPGYYAIGKAIEMTLLGHHIGDGLRAYEAAKEALKNVEAFAKADAEWKSKAGFSLLFDCYAFIGQWAASYEESIQYAKQAEKWVSIPNHIVRINQLREDQKSGVKWWKAQYKMAQSFYSRVSPELDAGKHAGGMSLLHCILDRALKEQPGYEIDENDLFDLLDDFLWLSLQTYNGIFQKFVTALSNNPKLQHVDGAAEQYIVFLNPIKYWLQLMPECPQKWKPTFQAHYETFMKSPFPIYPEMMKKVGIYFSGAHIETKSCPQCEHVNSALSPICIRCSYSFDKSQTPFSNEQSNTLLWDVSRSNPPIVESGRPKWYAIVGMIINLIIMVLLWVWAVNSQMKWYAVTPAVVVTIFTLPALPLFIRSLFNKKR